MIIEKRESRRRNLTSKKDKKIIVNIPIIENIKCLLKNKYESLSEKERIIPINKSNNIKKKLILSILLHQYLISINSFIKLMYLINF